MGRRKCALGKQLEKRAFVLGASGQVGSRLADHLEASNFSVYRVSREPKGSGSIRWDELESVARNFKADVIVNAASPNAQYAEHHPKEFLDWMRGHGKRLIDLGESVGASHIVSISTAHVYSARFAGTYWEESTPGNPHPYARGHLMLESELLQTGVSTIFRLSNSFGAPGSQGKLDSKLFTNDLLAGLISNGQGVVRGNPRSCRDFIPIRLLVECLDFVLGQPSFGLFNLSSGICVSLTDWADKLSKSFTVRTGRTGLIKFSEIEQAEPAYEISNSKLRNLGMDFDMDLEAELEGLIDYLENRD